MFAAVSGSNLQTLFSGFEDSDYSHNVLAAYGTLGEPFAALGAGDHVATLEENAINKTLHAYFAQVELVHASRRLLGTGVRGTRGRGCGVITRRLR